MNLDLTDLDTYDTDTLEHAEPHPAIAKELTKRRAAEAARRRCDECWHEGGQHHPICSNLAGGVPCGCCVDGDGERPAVHSAVRESNDWVASTMRGLGLAGGVL